MKKVSTYFMISCIICGYCGIAVAGTSVISNVLTQSNSYLKEAGLVQKKYSGIAREYASMKVGVPDNLAGGQVAAARAQAAGVQEQTERIQEQMAMAQEAQANAMAKVADINAKMTSAMETAQSTLSEGIAITEQYKTAITESVDTIKNAPDIAKGLADRAVNSVKDTAMGTVNSLKDTANSVKDQATGIAGDVSGKNTSSAGSETTPQTDMPAEESISDDTIENQATSVVGAYRQPVGVSAVYDMPAAQMQAVAVVQPAIQAAEPSVVQTSLSNQAAAIQSAAVMADDVVVNSAEMQALPMLAEIPVAETAVSAADVMAAAVEQPSKTAETEIQRSRLNIEEQLQQSSNRADTGKIRRLRPNKMTIDKTKAVEAAVAAKKPVSRHRFDDGKKLVDAKNKEIPTANITAERRTMPLGGEVKGSSLVHGKAAIRESINE